MNQRLVLTIAGVAAALLVGFAIWHAYQPRSADSAGASAPAPAPTSAPSSQSASEDPNAAAPRIEIDDLYGHFKAGDVTIIDVRDAEAFLAAHIPGALHIPLARIEGEVSYLPKGRPIVTYCT